MRAVRHVLREPDTRGDGPARRTRPRPRPRPRSDALDEVGSSLELDARRRFGAIFDRMKAKEAKSASLGDTSCTVLTVLRIRRLCIDTVPLPVRSRRVCAVTRVTFVYRSHVILGIPNRVPCSVARSVACGISMSTQEDNLRAVLVALGPCVSEWARLGAYMYGVTADGEPNAAVSIDTH
jgi:hypothetical protein